MKTRDSLHMPLVFQTRAVYESWLRVIFAQYKSGIISHGRYVERRCQAEKQWAYEVRCVPDRDEPDNEYGRYSVGEQTV